MKNDNDCAAYLVVEWNWDRHLVLPLDGPHIEAFKRIFNEASMYESEGFGVTKLRRGGKLPVTRVVSSYELAEMRRAADSHADGEAA